MADIKNKKTQAKQTKAKAKSLWIYSLMYLCKGLGLHLKFQVFKTAKMAVNACIVIFWIFCTDRYTNPLR